MAGSANVVLGQSIPAANVTMVHGTYHYDSTSQTFFRNFRRDCQPDNYNLSQATITQGSSTFFASDFQDDVLNVTRTMATAAHRPRDVTIVLDYSGSMNNESDLWNCESYQGSYQNTSNNTDSVYPQWGFYNTTFSPSVSAVVHQQQRPGWVLQHNPNRKWLRGHGQRLLPELPRC